MFNRLIAALLLAFLLAGCSKPAEVRPALWQVEGPKGEKAWLFGTIHALPEPVVWKSAKVEAAMMGANLLVLEVASILSSSKTEEAFASMAQSPNLPPLASRVPADLRDELTTELRTSGYRSGDIDYYETWAAMLMLQQAGSSRTKADSANGIDRALAKDWNGQTDEFEGAAAQFRIFDGLPEPLQRAMLAATLRDAPMVPARTKQLQQAWMKGDLDAIARAVDQDFAGQPELRAALLTNRNDAWLKHLEALLAAGVRPFVAVGAAHLAGKDGLPAMLTAKGYKLTRLQ
ncbi:MAG: TraB/GumN family protein [Novosphingobium sp.]